MTLILQKSKKDLLKNGTSILDITENSFIVSDIWFSSTNYYVGQSIQEWIKQNLWKTAFKNFTWSTLEYFVPCIRISSKHFTN